MTRTLLIAALAAVLLACGPDRRELAGRYVARSKAGEVVLVLKEDGQGAWSTELEEIALRWTRKEAGEIWLHTRGGAVLTCRVAEDGLAVALPDAGELVFRKEK